MPQIKIIGQWPHLDQLLDVQQFGQVLHILALLSV